MKIIFFGVTRKDKDSFTFFEKMDNYGVSCDVNILDSTITLHNVPRRLRGKIIHEIQEMFEIETIQTRQDDTEKLNNSSDGIKKIEKISKPAIIQNQGDEIVKCNNHSNDILDKKIEEEFLKFSRFNLNPKDKLAYLKKLNSELYLLNKTKIFFLCI